MSTLEVLAAILGSSVLSTVLGGLFNYMMQNRNYKKEYYKKILDKRILAYEKVNKVSSLLGTFVQMENCLVHAPFSSENALNYFCDQVRICIDENVWLGNETGTFLTELNTFIINEFDNKIAPSQPVQARNNLILEIAKSKYDNIDSFKRRLQFLVIRDIKNLHEINDFFEEPQSKKSFPLYNRTHKNPSDKEFFG